MFCGAVCRGGRYDSPASAIYSKRDFIARKYATGSHAIRHLPTHADEPADEAGAADDPIDGDPADADDGAAGAHRAGARVEYRP